MENKPPQRKQRTVKNSFIDVDSVTVSPGIGYSKWKQLTREKLKEREHIFLDLKVTKIETIVNKEMQTNGPISPIFECNTNIISNTLSSLNQMIDEWNGIDLTRTKTSTFQRFRDYFFIAKNSWHQKKSKLAGTTFWMNVFQNVKQYVDQQLISQSHQIRKRHLLLIMNGLFHETIKYPNTKPQSLINTAMVLHSKEIHQYLYQLHPSLTIQQWVNEQKSHETTKRYQQNAKIIYERVKQQITIIVSSPFNQITQTANNQSIQCPQNMNMSKEPTPPPIANPVRRTRVSAPTDMSSIMQPSVNSFHYGGYHAMSFRLNDIRHTPVLCLQSNHAENGLHSPKIFVIFPI